MALSTQNIQEKKWKSVIEHKGKEIFEMYLFEEKSQEDIRKELYQRYKKEHHGKAMNIQSLHNLVSNYTSAWSFLGYLTEKTIPNPKSKSKYHPNKEIYYATIKPFFDYAQEVLSNLTFEEKVKRNQLKIPEELKEKFKRPKLTQEEIKEYKENEFNDIEKSILEYIFSFEEVRKIVNQNKNLIQGIISFLERIFFYETDNDWPHRINHFFRKGFFIKDKSHFEVTQEIYLERIKEIEEFEKISFKHFRRLRNKIKLISNFSDQDYFNLIVDTSLRKYQYMPSLREIMKEKDPPKRHMLVRNWTQLYFFDEIPEGYN